MRVRVFYVGGPLDGQDGVGKRDALGPIPSILFRVNGAIHEYIVRKITFNEDARCAYVAFHSSLSEAEGLTAVTERHLQKVMDRAINPC